MHVHRAHRPRLLPAALLALVLALGPLTVSAQGRQAGHPVDTARVDTSKTDTANAARKPSPAPGAAKQDSKPNSPAPDSTKPSLDKAPYGLPTGWRTALFYAALLGMLGGFIADLLANAGIIQFPGNVPDPPPPNGVTQPGRKYALGFLSDMLIGAVSGMIAVLVDRPIGSLPTLMLIGLAGGVAAKSVLANVGTLVKIQQANARTETVRQQGTAEARLLGAKMNKHVSRADFQLALGDLHAPLTDQVEEWVQEAIGRIDKSGGA